MKAILIREHGDATHLEFADVDEPRPAAGQVKVKVEAAGVNFIDTYHRTGLYEVDLPFVLGQEGAGSVVELGSGVTGVAVGDRVAWAAGRGSYGELAVVDADRLVVVPPNVDTSIAAALLLQGLTAHYLATDTYPLSSGDTCLIHAGAGGVGLLLTQIAKIIGATVVTTVGSDSKVVLSERAGADQVINYANSDFALEATSALGDRPFDVIYDGVGKATFSKGLKLLKRRGMMVTFGNASGPVPEISPLILARMGSIFLTRPRLGDYIATNQELGKRAADLFRWISEEKLAVRIGATFDLWDAAKAHRALEGRETTGKVLLKP